MDVKRLAGVAAATAVLAGASMGSAHAWNWAGEKNQIWMNGGHGYGCTVKGNSLYQAYIGAWLADGEKGDGKIYAQSLGIRTAQDMVKVDSANRADGANWMAFASGTSGTASTVSQYGTWTAHLCRDRGWRGDPCSDDDRRLNRSIY